MGGADIAQAVKNFEIWEYFALWNLIDWTHFAVMWIAWFLWLNQYNLSNELQMPQGFAILKSFGDETPARLFLTNTDKEYSFLSFLNHIKQMRDNLSTYSTLSSIAGMNFMCSFNILKFLPTFF